MFYAPFMSIILYCFVVVDTYIFEQFLNKTEKNFGRKMGQRIYTIIKLTSYKYMWLNLRDVENEWRKTKSIGHLRCDRVGAHHGVFYPYLIQFKSHLLSPLSMRLLSSLVCWKLIAERVWLKTIDKHQQEIAVGLRNTGDVCLPTAN